MTLDGKHRRFLPRFVSRAVFALSALAAAPAASASESIKPDVMFRVAGLPVTNSMITCAVFCIGIALFFRFVLLRGGASAVPSKGQLLVESIMGALGSVLEPVMGAKAYRGAAPYLLCLFTYILAMNWSGLLPGVGSVGLSESARVAPAEVAAYEAEGFHAAAEAPDGMVEVRRFAPFIRPVHTDLNMTFALSLISFALFFYFVKKYAGFGALYRDWFGNKAEKGDVPAPVYYMLFPIFFAVGFIEVISACIRPLSLSLRLYGNVFGGETLLSQMHSMAWGGWGAAQILTWILPLPFYFLELLVGVVQAFVFTLLTALYIGLITNHDEPGHGAEAEGGVEAGR